MPQDVDTSESIAANNAIKEWAEKFDKKFKGGGDEVIKGCAKIVEEQHPDGVAETRKAKKAGKDSQPMMKAKGVKLAYGIHATNQVCE